jgi:ArsR family transcriptional regulator, arsenate/arsenite/antimonite-responsive transcriptional repressor
MGRSFEVLKDGAGRVGRVGTVTEARVERLVALGRALSDPVRVLMLGMMAEGRECCSLPDCGVPAEDQDVGICVCEFEGYFGMGQSRVSYHMKKLKEAGLIREEKRGKWSFYSLVPGVAEGLLSEAGELLTAR